MAVKLGKFMPIVVGNRLVSGAIGESVVDGNALDDSVD